MQTMVLEITMKTKTKSEAMTLFEKERAEFLANARWIAYKIGQKKGSVTIDDVREEIKIPSFITGKVLGAVFNQRDHMDKPLWEKVGYKPTTIKSSHGRLVTVWRHKDFHSYQEAML